MLLKSEGVCFIVNIWVQLISYLHLSDLNNLEAYGIIGLLLKWFTNYLNDRQQCYVRQFKSTKQTIIICGIPQGSSLGPLLFLLYINELF